MMLHRPAETRAQPHVWSHFGNAGSSELHASTMDDLLVEELDVAFVGINPAIYSVLRGHYFARRSNKFWPCISRSKLTLRARRHLGVEVLGPEHDRALLLYGVGFTDLVKRATARAADLAPRELSAGVETLLEKIERYRPRIACFHGVTGYRYVHRELVGDARNLALGLQDVRLGSTRIFVVPNPSGANAHFTRAEQTGWYDNLAAFLEMQQHRIVKLEAERDAAPRPAIGVTTDASTRINSLKPRTPAFPTVKSSSSPGTSRSTSSRTISTSPPAPSSTSRSCALPQFRSRKTP